MLFLVFSIGHERYAIEGRQVVEVVPLVTLRPIAPAPDYVAGLLRYREHLVPVLDLRQLLQGQPCPARLSTRIILVHYRRQAGAQHTLGLIAERVTDTVTREPTDFAPAGITVDNAPYLGDMVMDEQGMVQCVRVGDLLPTSVHAALFPDAAE